MTLIFALSYGGKQDILYGIRKMLSDDPGIDLESLDEAKFSLYLENAATPDPDLILRTSGEHRISNFYLWQAAYSELEFSNTLWPDFTTEELSLVLNRFKHRERRFGKVT
jgi:undecaprenyl diphosphate synthase